MRTYLPLALAALLAGCATEPKQPAEIAREALPGYSIECTSQSGDETLGVSRLPAVEQDTALREQNPYRVVWSVKRDKFNRIGDFYGVDKKVRGFSQITGDFLNISLPQTVYFCENIGRTDFTGAPSVVFEDRWKEPGTERMLSIQLPDGFLTCKCSVYDTENKRLLFELASKTPTPQWAIFRWNNGLTHAPEEDIVYSEALRMQESGLTIRRQDYNPLAFDFVARSAGYSGEKMPFPAAENALDIITRYGEPKKEKVERKEGTNVTLDPATHTGSVIITIDIPPKPTSQ